MTTKLSSVNSGPWTAATPVLRAEVSTQAGRVDASLTDTRQETVQLFEDLTPAQREQLASDAWSIGLRALANAYAQSQQAHLQDVGKSLMSELERHLNDHVMRHQEATQLILRRYFDPSDGQVTERLKAFVDDQGVLARLLEKYVSPQNSVLARTLAENVGEQSLLFKKLSPTESEGMVQVLEAKLNEVMRNGQTHLIETLDPMHEGGTMARFIAALRAELSGSQEDREKQLAAALAALDANNEQSLISRLMRETDRARKAVMDAVNPELADSPMAVLTSRLTRMLADHVDTQTKTLAEQRERQEKFEHDIREAIARIETQKRASEVTTVGGFDFEDAMVVAVSQTLAGGCFIIDRTGNTTGSVRHAKVGDLVVHFSAESAFQGAKVVFEAKRDASYNVVRALEELERARKNREASVGVFVMAASHAPVGFPRFGRFGQDILVTWDDADPNALAWLQAATIAAMSLASRTNRIADEGDIKALNDVENRLTSEVKRLEKMEGLTANITRDAAKLTDELRKGKDKLDLLIRKGREVLMALEVEVADVQAERASPILLPKGTSEPAQLSADTSMREDVLPD